MKHNKIKNIFLILIVLLLTGCSGTYNLKINEDLSVNEELNITINNKDDAYDKTLRLFEENSVDPKKYNITPSDKKVKIEYKEKYNSFEDYILNSNLYKMLFDDIYYSYDKKNLNVNTKSKLKLDGNTSDNLVNNYDISLLQINVETPYKVVKSNADSSNDNIHSWVLDKNTTKKEIDYSINIDAKNNRFIQIIVLLLITLFLVIFGFIYGRKFISSRKIN